MNMRPTQPAPEPTRDATGAILWRRFDALLGTMPDTVLANRIQCSVGAVRMRRRKLGVEAYAGRRVFKTQDVSWADVDWSLCLSEIALRHGVDRSTVRYHRKRLLDAGLLSETEDGVQRRHLITIDVGAFGVPPSELRVVPQHELDELQGACNLDARSILPDAYRGDAADVIETCGDAPCGDRKRVQPFTVEGGVLTLFSDLGFGVSIEITDELREALR